MTLPLISSFFFAIFLILICYSSFAKRLDYPTASLSTTWTINESAPNSGYFLDNSMVISILLKNSTKPTKFSCGFICKEPCTAYHFGIFIVEVYDDDFEFNDYTPQVVWLANRNDPVRLGATLNLTSSGELILQDFDGSTVWTTNTSGKSVAGMNFTETGNLVLFNVHGSVVWQSFDYPTDCLLPGQKLFPGQKLIASVSSTNWTTHKSSYSFELSNDGFIAYYGANPIPYSSKYYSFGNRSYAEFQNGGLFFFYLGDNSTISEYTIPLASSSQYIKLMSDGHLKVFEWQNGWTEVADLLTNEFGKCDTDTYPTACGRNSICTGDGQCSCPGSSNYVYPVTGYFRAVNDNEPYLGCYESNPLTCNATQDQYFLRLDNFTHFTSTAGMKAVTVDICRQECMNNCSCKAVIYEYQNSGDEEGTCYLLYELLTFSNINPNDKASAFIKVQNVRLASLSTLSPSRKVATIIGSTIGSFLLLLVVSLACYMMLVVRKRRKFSDDELKTATDNFSKKLGQGGFGSVFEGTLGDGSKIAVKCLEGLGQIKKSFLAEVESIGSIHHVNLVRLRGFCARKSQRLLVYEFMSNGSLDQWIYNGNMGHVLEWACRKKIIFDLAKGLAYLHEDCRQKIINLDIKPQNILLDSDFNAKVSDFGLSKLIDRNHACKVLIQDCSGLLLPYLFKILKTGSHHHPECQDGDAESNSTNKLCIGFNSNPMVVAMYIAP
ncbi:Apple-like protein [Artemisia annua]|uniref:Receptor-like serine/threonine-protein kinase n=1 Tax=Artemisia annua TaxID=35608 RepID=A0A2U1MSU5_ARTAN|nr:Apple-like protein [Artemisia annua]